MALSSRPIISVAVFTKKTPFLILKRCIQSIKDQTVSNLEIILLDANDMDSSYKEAIQGEPDFLSNIHYIELPEGQELAHGKNAVLKAYHGEFLTFLSAQDTMPPRRLEQVLNVFAQDASIVSICTGMNVQQSNILEHSDYAMYTETYQYLSQLIFHRDCFRYIHAFDENLVAHCDDDVALQLFFLDQIHSISSEDTTISVCPDCYHQVSDLAAAIGYRQLLTKYFPILSKKENTTTLRTASSIKKQLMEKAASSYQQAGILHRYIQFKCKGLFS